MPSVYVTFIYKSLFSWIEFPVNSNLLRPKTLRHRLMTDAGGCVCVCGGGEGVCVWGEGSVEMCAVLE